MPFEIKLSGNKYYIPFVSELTMREYVLLRACKTDKERVDLFLKTDSGTITADLSRVLALVNDLEQQVIQVINGEAKTQDTIIIHFFDRPIKFTKDMGKLPFWAMTKVKAILSRMGEEAYNAHEDYPDLCAHYLYSKATGHPYNEDKAQEFVEEVENLPFETVIRLGDFFCFIQSRFWLPKASTSKLNREVMKKVRGLKFSTSTAI